MVSRQGFADCENERNGRSLIEGLSADYTDYAD